VPEGRYLAALLRPFRGFDSGIAIPRMIDPVFWGHDEDGPRHAPGVVRFFRVPQAGREAVDEQAADTMRVNRTRLGITPNARDRFVHLGEERIADSSR